MKTRILLVGLFLCACTMAIGQGNNVKPTVIQLLKDTINIGKWYPKNSVAKRLSEKIIPVKLRNMTNEREVSILVGTTTSADEKETVEIIGSKTIADKYVLSEITIALSVKPDYTPGKKRLAVPITGITKKRNFGKVLLTLEYELTDKP